MKYLVAIVEDDYSEEASLHRVEAENTAHAMHKAVALYHGVDIDEVDLDLAYDITIHAFLEDDIQDHTA